MKKKKETPDIKKIKDMIEALNKGGIPWTQTSMKDKLSPVIIPSVWIQENEAEVEDEQTVEFMQECRERTASMKDNEKCTKCKLRFRCYTEIKIEKKRKTRVRKPKLPGRLIPKRRILPPAVYGSNKIKESSISIIDWSEIIEDVAKDTRLNTKKKSKTS